MTDYRATVRQSRLYPVLVLEGVISAGARRLVLKIGVLCFLIILASLFPFGSSRLIFGILFILLAILLTIWLTELFFRSYYYESIITNEYSKADRFTFTVGRILLNVKSDRVLEAFSASVVGVKILRRLGVPPTETGPSVEAEPASDSTPFDANSVLTLSQLVAWLWQSYPGWQNWLRQFNVEEADLQAVTQWTVRDIETEARRERWWARENLNKIPAVADAWAYGGSYVLDRYAQDLSVGESLRAKPDQFFYPNEIAELQAILARTREANAILVGTTLESLETMLQEFADQAKKRVLLFHTTVFLANLNDRLNFDRELVRVFEDAEFAGNVILAIDNFPGLISAGENLGSDVLGLLEPYLASNRLQFIALATTEAFERFLEPRVAFLAHFEKIGIADLGPEPTLIKLENLAERLEKTNQIMITYSALKEIYLSAERYFQTDLTADKASDLLEEAVPWALGRGRRVLDRTVVDELVKQKTNIPVGTIEPSERQQLLGLEAALSSRVIGQETALHAVANALRRARTGVRNPKRPMGSFLFLGPTGVGKTETAKALAAVVFGREELLLRLDMSEYQGPAALERLIGSFNTGEPGVLANLLRQHPYGVLLLDEFEKTDAKVMNLFLQILDEGFFSDMSGRRVNARNLILIATSNAGADQVWQMIKSGKDPAAAKEEIMTYLIMQGVYKPELLNRFDEVIVYHPLQAETLAQVARLLLQKLAVRLLEQGITLAVNDDLVKAVVAGGSNETLGARPMQRFIQDGIEERVAEGMIKGEIKSGQYLSFGQDLNLKIS